VISGLSFLPKKASIVFLQMLAFFVDRIIKMTEMIIFFYKKEFLCEQIVTFES
jgi:hypothetical protein